MRPLTEHDHVIRLDGDFGPVAARALLREARGLPPGEGFVVDFSDTTVVEDVAVAFLAEALAGRPYRLRGLSVHHERLLRYLGLASRADLPLLPASTGGPLHGSREAA